MRFAFSERPALAARYVIEREIATADAATVYLARDLRHDRPVALKVLRAESDTPTIDEARFVREIKLLARLQHPFILPLHDSGHVEDVIYYNAPYVEGESLRRRIGRERKLRVDDALRVATAMAREPEERFHTMRDFGRPWARREETGRVN